MRIDREHGVVRSSSVRSLVLHAPSSAPRVVTRERLLPRVITAVAQRGPTGPTGPMGPPANHGFVSYVGSGANQPIMLSPNVVAPIVFDSVVENDRIPSTSPFKGHAFWDGEVLRGRAAWDVLTLRLDISSTALVADGDLKFTVDIGGDKGVIQTLPRALKEAAGVVEMISEAFVVYIGTTFFANGGMLCLRASVPTSITIVRLNVFPMSAYSP